MCLNNLHKVVTGQESNREGKATLIGRIFRVTHQGAEPRGEVTVFTIALFNVVSDESVSPLLAAKQHIRRRHQQLSQLVQVFVFVISSWFS